MKATVLKLATQIRERIKHTPPEIIEVDSQLILIDMAQTLFEDRVIDGKQYAEMQEEIMKLYNV